MGTSLQSYCEENHLLNILNEWHSDKNLPLTPDAVSFGSHKKVWWLCEKQHEWQAAVYARTGSNTGCPYCVEKKILLGVNDLASQHPELARQWHSEKNAPLTPKQVTPGSHKKVWWVCEKGHEWQAQIKSRADGTGCPVCAKRKIVRGENDLAATHPELASQWHPSKNGAMTARDVVSGSVKKVWWVCEKGHEWQASIVSRSGNGNACPVCAGKVVSPGENDLASAFPEIAEEWHPTKNGTLTAEQVTAFTNRRAWWVCPKGHEYHASIGHRVSAKSGCPYCSGNKVLPGFNDLATLVPHVACEWHPTLNGKLTPQQVTANSHKKVWWKCNLGHVWKTVVYSRTGKRPTGCPVCAGRVKEKRQDLYRLIETDREQDPFE